MSRRDIFRVISLVIIIGAFFGLAWWNPPPPAFFADTRSAMDKHGITEVCLEGTLYYNGIHRLTPVIINKDYVECTQ